MKKMLLHFNILIEKEQQKKGKSLYVAYMPTLGISDFGKTPEQAVQNIEASAKIYLETLGHLKKPIPHPDSEEVYLTTRKIALDTPVYSLGL